jgi:hypothetical protein
MLQIVLAAVELFAKFMKKVLKIAILILVSALAIIATIAFWPRRAANPESFAPPCETEHEVFVIRGDSLGPEFADGQEVKLLPRYYDCHSLSAGDAVAYRWAGNKDAPLAKIVKAVAGDRWRMELMPEQNTYQIEVNDQWLKNSEGAPYQIPGKKAKMLLLYANSYPRIPEGACLILGNVLEGSDDSVKFGLAAQENIVGKIKPF